MSKVITLPTKNSRVNEAAKWIAKFDRGLTDDEKTLLEEWLASDPQNRQVILEVAKIWDKLDHLSQLADVIPEEGIKPRRLSTAMLAMAATVILAVTVVLWSLIERPNSIEPEVVYETSIGEHSTVNLVDGTNLTLNTNSRVKVKYAERHRMLILERGEIFVEVAHDPDRPLSVYVGSNVVQAVGTAFSVRINNSQEIELVVSNGKVLVGVDSRVKEGQSPESPISLNPTSQAILGEQRVILGSSESVVENLNPEDLQVSMSWRDGTIVFRGESLEEALLEVNRYTPIEFVFLDEELKNVRIAGLFKAGDVDGLLSTLRANFNITNERVGEEKVLLKAE